jgi:hypothetical protein
MFYNKTPIIWGQDPLLLVVRKLVRSIVSSRPLLWSIEQMISGLEKSYPESAILPSLYRYIIGSYIFHGYREGLRQFALGEPKGEAISSNG